MLPIASETILERIFIINSVNGKNNDIMKMFVRKDKAYKFMKNVRGTPAYYQCTFCDLLATIR